VASGVRTRALGITLPFIARLSDNWCALVLLLPFAGTQPCEDYLLNAYFWLMLGILFRMPTIHLASLAPAAMPKLQISGHGFC
jgi:hypothetical protein